MARDDAAVLVESFQTHYEELLRFLLRRTGDAGRAADLAHDTYLKLAAMGPLDEKIENPRAYLYRVAGNLAIDAMRREGRLNAQHTGAAPDEAVPDPAPRPDAVLLARQRLRLLDEALAELPPNARQAFLSFRVEGLPHAEIASRLGVSESMVAKYIAQALRHCRDHLWRMEKN